ncbi:MAG TPA: carbon-nitrogen family hydrolase [Nannocystis exedens]|nr:carbon-nitrogen family hydrolase [Nannocystis exedens]
MKIAAIQSDIIWEDPEANYIRLRPQIAAAAASGARMVILPEMFACGFSMETSRITEPLEGPSAKFLAGEARAHGLWICGSIPERSTSERPHNTLVIAGPNGERHRYRKIHPFTFADEHLHYAAGHEHLRLTIEGLRIAFFVCYDLRFADEFWALAPEVDAYIVVANWPKRRRMHWSTLLRARAIENQAYVVGLNRVGLGDGVEYCGDSAVIDPWGETLVSAAGDSTTLFADLNPQRVADARKKFPVLNDRRAPSHDT